jgi:hypothetical protein
MRSESLSSQANLGRIVEGKVATLNAVKSFHLTNEIGRQLVWIPCQSGTQPFTDLCADCAAIATIDLNTVWILAHYGALLLQFYSITSSAAVSKVDGTDPASACAVFLNFPKFVKSGCCDGSRTSESGH